MHALQKLALTLLVTVAACTRVGAPTTASPEPRQGAEDLVPTPSALSGMATLGGQRLRVSLELSTDTRGRGTAHLEIPDLPLTADGPAMWRGDALELDLRYDGACPGDLRIRATRDSDGVRVEGTISAKDCTGEESGTLAMEVTTRPSLATPARSPR